MIKSTCLVLCALVAVSMAQDAATSPVSFPAPNLIPFAANLVKKGCSQLCSTLNALCSMSPIKAQCTTALEACPAVCTQLETCITGCGPNCDSFEANCVSSGIIYAPVAGVFCPVVGQACDVACVSACPQNLLLDMMTQVLQQFGATVQGFVSQFITMPQ